MANQQYKAPDGSTRERKARGTGTALDPFVGEQDSNLLVGGQPVSDTNRLPVAVPATVATQATAQAIADSLGTDGDSPPVIVGTGVRGWLRAIYERLVAGIGITGGTVTANLGTIAGAATASNQATANTALGAPADAEATGNGSIVAILKRLRTLLAALATEASLAALLDRLPNSLGQKGRGASLGVTLSTEDLTALAPPAAAADPVPAGVPATSSDGIDLGGAGLFGWLSTFQNMLGRSGNEPPSVSGGGYGLLGWTRGTYEKAFLGSFTLGTVGDAEALPGATTTTGISLLRRLRAPRALLSAPINLSASGDGTIVAAVAGQKVKVAGLYLMGKGDVDVAVKSGASTTLIPALPLAVAGNGAVLPVAPVGEFWTETAVGEALVLNLSAAVAVRGIVRYVQEA